jgi:biotin synthase
MIRIAYEDILDWLRTTDEAQLANLWRMADDVRNRYVGGDVHLRGLIELSNHCVRRCAYCGLWLGNRSLRRYRMSADEVLACAHRAMAFGYGTVVLQSGEDPGLTADSLAEIIARIKWETSLAVTLSLGERSDDEARRWREAGADRYLLRFETSNRALYDRIHPPLPGVTSDRVAMLRRLRGLGYEIGSGVMIGIPGQTYEDLARDITLFAELELDMIGVGPFLVHPETPMGDPRRLAAPFGEPLDDAHDRQVPADEGMTYKTIALSRLACPRANIPSTTALATLDKRHGRELGLQRGANVVMPNLTPPAYRALYEIYPDKACVHETAEACHTCLAARIASLGRDVGRGRGDSPNYQLRRAEAVPQ